MKRKLCPGGLGVRMSSKLCWVGSWVGVQSCSGVSVRVRSSWIGVMECSEPSGGVLSCPGWGECRCSEVFGGVRICPGMVVRK
jgi:hypothetical protein